MNGWLDGRPAWSGRVRKISNLSSYLLGIRELEVMGFFMRRFEEKYNSIQRSFVLLAQREPSLITKTHILFHFILFMELF